jgi:hypothetical protein
MTATTLPRSRFSQGAEKSVLLPKLRFWNAKNIAIMGAIILVVILAVVIPLEQ